MTTMRRASKPEDLGCTCYKLRQAARLVSRTYDLFLAPCGINIGQFGILATLDVMEGEPLSKLADALQMERTTLTRNLTPLEKLGYILIGRGLDKRVRLLSLTREGKKTLTAALPKWRAAQLSLEKQLGKTETNMLNAMLDDTLHRLSAEREVS